MARKPITLDKTAEPDGGDTKEVKDRKTRQYTRKLTPDEYKVWVRQTVSGDIWRRVLTSLSLFGLASIVALVTATNTIIDSRFSWRITKEILGSHAKILERGIGNPSSNTSAGASDNEKRRRGAYQRE